MHLFLLRRAKEVSALDWKVISLVVLLVSAVAVTIGVAVSELHVVSVLGIGFPRVADPSVGPLEVIDDESPPG
jgi:hypothetical protein